GPAPARDLRLLLHAAGRQFAPLLGLRGPLVDRPGLGERREPWGGVAPLAVPGDLISAAALWLLEGGLFSSGDVMRPAELRIGDLCITGWTLAGGSDTVRVHP